MSDLPLIDSKKVIDAVVKRVENLISLINQKSIQSGVQVTVAIEGVKEFFAFLTNGQDNTIIVNLKTKLTNLIDDVQNHPDLAKWEKEKIIKIINSLK